MHIALTIRFHALGRCWTIGNKEHEQAGDNVFPSGTIHCTHHTRWLSSTFQTRTKEQQTEHEKFLAMLDEHDNED